MPLTPLKQIRDMVPADEVACDDHRTLMLSPSGMPACVFTESTKALERRGFALPPEVPCGDLSTKQSEALEKAKMTGGSDAAKTGDRPFVTTWKVISPNESITIPVGNAAGAYTINWGDGSTSAHVTGDQTHVYCDAGTYTVAITGDFEQIYINDDPDNAFKLLTIEQWGDVSWTSMNSAFYGARNMIYNATDIPNLSGVTDMYAMFASIDSFNSDLSDWNVSGVTDMSAMFASIDSFNSDLSDWNVSGVTDMYAMFASTDSFNGDISTWNVSGVKDMSYMFGDADSFNGDLSDWDVSGVVGMVGMFQDADSFNGDLSDWDVSGVVGMKSMFQDADSFNGDLSDWDVSGVVGMKSMFQDADSFNGDLSDWDVSGVVGMKSMFQDADSFNGDLSDWDVSGVMDMSYMFSNADSFNGDLSDWDVSGVTNIRGIFSDASSFDQNLGNWYIVLDNTSVDTDTDVVGTIMAQNAALARQHPIYEIGSGVDSDLFEIDDTVLKTKPLIGYSGKTEYAVNITSTGWFGTANSRIVDVTVMSAGGIEPEQTQVDVTTFITTWRTASDYDSITIPVGAAAGRYTILWGDGTDSIGVSGNQDHMYRNAGTYTVTITGDFERIYLNGDMINAPKLQSIEQWGDIKWISMDSAFEGARYMIYNAHDPPNLSGVTDMSDMFSGASSFNSDLSDWDVSGVRDMSGMFNGASSFNSDLSDWDVSGVTETCPTCSQEPPPSTPTSPTGTSQT